MNLQHELGVFGATMMGLGSIIGTGAFVSIGIAAGFARGQHDRRDYTRACGNSELAADI